VPVSTDASQSYRPDIDGLRAVAIAAVVGYHAFPAMLPGGFVGVDVFFVISGYLITQVILRGLASGRFKLSEFYRRRLRRIVPALLVVLLVCGAFGWFALLPGEFARLGKSTAWSAAFVANVYFARALGYFDPITQLHPLLHLWSLGVEEQFYFAWPVLLLLAYRRGQIVPALSALIVVSLMVSILGAWQPHPQYFYLLRARAWELAVGGLLAARWHLVHDSPAASVEPDPIGRRLAWAAAIAGFVLVAASTLLLHADVPFPGAWALVPSTGAVLLIAAGPSAALNRHVLASRPMVFIGQISYPLYLWHWPLLSFARIMLRRPPPPMLAATLVLTAVVAAYATFRLVERPIRFGSTGQKAVPGLLAGLAALTLLGVAVGRHWVPTRLSNQAFSEWEAAAGPGNWHVPMVRGPGESWTLSVPSRRHKTALFVGDSHIQQYSARVQRVVQARPDAARSALFLSYPGCPPLPDLGTMPGGSSCDTFFKQAMEQAVRSDIDTVVFGAFWEFYLIGEFSEPDKWVPGHHLHGGRDLAFALESPATQQALEEFRRAVTSLVASGRRVFIVLSNPTSPDFDPLFLLPVAARLSIPRAQHLNIGVSKQIVDATAFEAFVAPLMTKLRDIAAQSGARVIDPRSTLCEAMACLAIDTDGLPTHIDSNHITGSFARERALFVDDILLGGSAPDRGTTPAQRP
jgi:peptidoglycan/LPS O-acetylase OafA/YrhL